MFGNELASAWLGVDEQSLPSVYRDLNADSRARDS
jgi:hypothetical protein